MLADFYIPRLSKDEDRRTEKSYFMSNFIKKSLDPVKNSVFKKPVKIFYGS